MSEAEAVIAALSAEHDALAEYVQGLTAEDLARPSGVPGWDVAQVLSHLGIGAEMVTASPRDAAGSELRVELGFTSGPLDLASAARWRLSEIALHSWDVRVAFDPRATLSPQATATLMHGAPDLPVRIGDADGLRGRRQLIEVKTSEPTASFALRLEEPIAVDSELPAQADGTLMLPAEAWLRLLAGRLPAEYTPEGVVTAGVADLDQLRSVFVGYCGPEPHVEPAQPALPRRRRRWVRRWLRRLGISAATIFVVVTAFSLIFNAVTQPPPVVDPGFGAYVQVGSSSVHYQTWGTSGSPIVLVPGFLESSIVWSKVGPLLGEDHIVYALDLPGHGYTRYSGPMTLDGQAELVDGFVQALHLQRPLLVGHSLGAAMIGSVALQHPQDVGKVIFADGDGLPLSLPPKLVRSVILDSPYATTVLRIAERWTTVDKWFIRMTCGPTCPTPSSELARQWVDPLRQRSDEHAFHELVVNSDYGLTPRQVSAISVPSAIIWGSDDSQGGSLSATIVNLHHPSQHIINGAGHLTMIADPQAFAQAVEDEAAPS